MRFTTARFDDLRDVGQAAGDEPPEVLRRPLDLPGLRNLPDGSGRSPVARLGADEAGRPASPGEAGAARSARLDAMANQVRPLVLARDHTLPLTAALIPLFPDGALRRGITVAVAGAGATSLALALAAAPVHAGSWVAFTDLPEGNLVAAAEAGIALERVACLRTGGQWAAAVAATIGAFDIVVIGLVHRVRAADVRRLGARARERGSVIVVVQSETSRAVWPDAPDLTLTATGSRWVGLGEGHGHLRARTVEVVAEGRRGFARPRRAEVVFPLGVAPVEVAAGVGVGAAPAAAPALGLVGPGAGRAIDAGEGAVAVARAG